MSKTCVFWREGKWRGDPGGVAAIAARCKHLRGKHCTQANGACLVRSARIQELALGDFGCAPVGVPAFAPVTDHTDLANALAGRHNQRPPGNMPSRVKIVPTDDEGREVRPPDVPVRDPERDIYAETLSFLRQRYPNLAAA